MRQLYLLILLLATAKNFAQIKGTIIDRESKQPIPLVNIWVVGEDKGTTANEEGYFEIKETDANKTLLFSAVGYGDLSIKIADLKSTVIMLPKTVELNEVVINKNKGIHKRIINPLKEIKDLRYNGIHNTPAIEARFIPYKNEYASTPFLHTLTIQFMKSYSKHTGNVRLYRVAEDGSPGELLYDENLLITLKKKKEFVTLDLSKLGLQIPTEGFFVAFEWLLIEENRSPGYKNMTDENGKLRPEKDWEFIGWYYKPTLAADMRDTGEQSWFFGNGKWVQNFPQSMSKDKYYALAAEITLTD